MKSYPQKPIIINGKAYDPNTGEAIGQSKSRTGKHGRLDVLDLRTPQSIVQRPQNAISKRQAELSSLGNSQLSDEPMPHKKSPSQSLKHFNAKLIAKSKEHIGRIKASTHKTKKAKPSVVKLKSEHLDLDYADFVLINAVWPPKFFALWQLSLVRTIASPQTWLLITLPVLLLQVRVLQHVTTNEALQKGKQFFDPANYATLTWSVGVALCLFITGIILRSIISNTGIALRLRQIDKRSLHIKAALRSAVSSLLRQALNYLIHLCIICLVTVTVLFVIYNIFNSTNLWISVNKYQLLVFISIIWLVVLILLYSKHWLQVGLLARSSQSEHLQLQSLKLLGTAPLSSFITGFLAVSGIIIGYCSILLIDWQMTEYFVHNTGSPTILVLVGITILTVVVLTTMQYYQQNIWARQYYFVASQAPNKDTLLYMEKEKPASLVPLYIAIALGLIVVVIYMIVVSWQAANIRGFLANWHATVPQQINFTLPVKK